MLVTDNVCYLFDGTVRLTVNLIAFDLRLMRR